MKSVLHTSDSDYGHFERRSPRDYTHIVVVMPYTPEEVAAEYDARLVQERKWLVEYQAVVDSGVAPTHVRSGGRLVPSYCTLDDYRGFVVSACEAIEQLTRRKVEEVERARRRWERHEGGFYGWSQSAANAEKMAQKARAAGYHEVKVLPVVRHGG